MSGPWMGVVRLATTWTAGCLLALALGGVPAAAKGTGYIFVSNEKSHFLTVLDPNTY